MARVLVRSLEFEIWKRQAKFLPVEINRITAGVGFNLGILLPRFPMDGIKDYIRYRFGQWRRIES
ncbi:MAG: hypothetical protein DCF22_23320 [Leptolyngbya sp.]|nr:MAG: hypothetical protein DCF22_23320 [Leptolyngbya sp.]